MKATVYTRVSTDDQVKGASPKTQEKDCRALIEREGWEHVGTFVDDGVSSSILAPQRPAFAKLLDAEPEIVVCWRSDRLARDEYDWYALRRFYPSLRIVSVADNVDTANGNEVMDGFRVLMNADEKRRIVQRTMRGRRERLTDGRWVGGDAPFGHAVLDNKLVVNEAEALVVRRARELIVDELHSTRRAAEILNAEGLLRRPHRNRRDGEPQRWDSYQLRRILKFESLSGKWTWGKHGKSDAITLEIPPVLDRAEWLELREVLRKTERRPYVATNVYPLSGRIESPCGGHYVGLTADPRRGRLMRCTGKKHAPRCSCPQLVARDLELAVWSAAFDLFADEDRLLALAPGGAAGQVDASAASKEVARLDRQIASKEKAIVDSAAKYIAAGVDAKWVTAAVAQIEADLAILTAQRADMESWHAETAESETRKQRLRYFAKQTQVLLSPPLEVMHEVFRLLDAHGRYVPGEHPKVVFNGELQAAAIEGIAYAARELSGIASRRDTARRQAS